MCSSRRTAASASTAEISTAGTTRTPRRSPAAIASETPLTVSWSDSARSSTPASAARARTSAGASAPSELVECDCRSKRSGIRGTYAIASGACLVAPVARPRARVDGRLERGRISVGGEQLGDVTGEGFAQGADGEVVAAGLFGERRVGGGLDRVEIGVGGLGVGGALGGFCPQRLQVGQGSAELLLGEGVAVLELAQDGDQLMAQPTLLGIGAEQQGDVGKGVGVGLVCHREHPCSSRW